MRKNIVAGNWKMNTTLPEGLALAKGLDEALKGKTINCDVIIGTPFTHLASVAAAIDTDKIGVAAENCADKEKVLTQVKFLPLWLLPQVQNM